MGLVQFTMAINYLALILLTRAFIYHSQKPRPNTRSCPFSRCLKYLPEQHPTSCQGRQQEQHPQRSPAAAAACAHLAQTAARCCPNAGRRAERPQPGQQHRGGELGQTPGTAGRRVPACAPAPRGPGTPAQTAAGDQPLAPHRADGPATVGLGSRTKRGERINPRRALQTSSAPQPDS